MSIFDIRNTRQVADRFVLATTLSTINTYETLLSPRAGHKLAIVYVMAWQDATGAVDVRLRDSANGDSNMVSDSIERGNNVPVIQSAVGLLINGELQVQVSDLAVTISAWAMEVKA